MQAGDTGANRRAGDTISELIWYSVHKKPLQTGKNQPLYVKFETRESLCD